MSTYPTPEHGQDDEHLHLTGKDVLDEHHTKVGTVSDIVFDDGGSPRWAVVDPGPMRSAKFVPIEGSYTTDHGEVVIPYAKATIKTAPKANRDHIVDPMTERELAAHYNL